MFAKFKIKLPMGFDTPKIPNILFSYILHVILGKNNILHGKSNEISITVH